MKEIQLAHGGGGEEMNELLNKLFKVLDNEILRDANDAAIVSFSQCLQGENLNFAKNEGLNSTQSKTLNSTQNTKLNYTQNENSNLMQNDNLNFTQQGLIQLKVVI